MLLKDGIDEAACFNNLLRSVDKRGAHVVFEKLIIPGKNGIFSNGNAMSQIEDIDVKLNRAVNYQTMATTYGSKGAWTNLHVAVLAYDGLLTETPVSDAMMEVEATDGLSVGLGNTQRAHVSTARIANVGCEYTLFFKEA